MPQIIAYDTVVNTSYLQALASASGSTAGKAETPTYSQTAPAVSTFAKRAWAIEFETGKATFKPETAAMLDELLNQMSISGLAIQVSGHTDSIGSPSANLLLSKKRADAVRSWLQANAVSEFPDGRIRIRAFGDAQPIADNGSAEGRAKNRRVEFVKF